MISRLVQWEKLRRGALASIVMMRELGIKVFRRTKYVQKTKKPRSPLTHVSCDSSGCDVGHGSYECTAEYSVQLLRLYVQPAHPSAATHEVQHCACPPVAVCDQPPVFGGAKPPGMAVPTMRTVLRTGHSALRK